LAFLDRIRRSERVEPYETVRKRSDGSLVDVSISVSPLRNAAGEVIGASKIARDITERKQVELVLAERNLQLSLAERDALVGSVACDVDTDKLQISAGYARFMASPLGLARSCAANGRSVCTLTTWRGWVNSATMLSVQG